MDTLIWLIIYTVIFALVGCGLYWTCKKFEMPQPVLWLCGAILLVIILVFLANQLGVGGSHFHLRNP